MKARTIFADITIKTCDGSKGSLKPYFEAAYAAIHQLANENGAFVGMVGRRARVSERSVTRSMRKHGIYGKAR